MVNTNHTSTSETLMANTLPLNRDGWIWIGGRIRRPSPPAEPVALLSDAELYEHWLRACDSMGCECARCIATLEARDSER